MVHPAKINELVRGNKDFLDLNFINFVVKNIVRIEKLFKVVSVVLGVVFVSFH